jgi:hypothetical protein
MYQNCAEQPLESYDASSVAATAPFAYEAKIDHIAYMSCSHMSGDYDQNAFFSFKAGAFNDDSGLRLSSKFISATRNLATADKAEVLKISSANKDVFLSMGVRPISMLQNVYGVGTNYVGTFFGSLSASGIAMPLAQNTYVNKGVGYVNDFPALGVNPEFSDTIQLTATEADARNVRNDLIAGTSALAITYNKIGADSADALGPQKSSNTSVYGVGYKMNFEKGFGYTSQGASMTFADNFVNGINVAPIRVIKDNPDSTASDITEISLIDGQPTGALWDCKKEWRFIVVKQLADVGTKIFCNDRNKSPTNAQQQELLTLLRKFLKQSDWEVDLTNRCLIPKVTTHSCYGSSQLNVNYGATGGTCDSSLGSCPQYVSICKRR